MSKAKMETEAGKQTIEQLQARYHNLHTQKITADANLENARQNLDKLKDEARQKFGTDDVDELREKLRAMKAENEEKRKNYQAELDRIETDLQSVEKNLDAADALEDNPEGES
jgi:DNA repair exonuclease SbcCD ATPase subunit